MTKWLRLRDASVYTDSINQKRLLGNKLVSV